MPSASPAGGRPQPSELALLLVVGIGGAVVAVALGVPAGAMLGAMVAVAVLNLVRRRSLGAPKGLGPMARIAVGTVVGSLATREVMASLGANIWWALGATLALLIAGFTMAWCLQRFFGVDWATALIAMSPGGLAEMVALADEVQAKVEVVAGMHLARKFAALSVGVAVLVIAQ